MPEDKKQTAAESLARLEADPEWRARRDAREADFEARRAQHHAEEELLVGEIRAAGYDIESVWDLVNNRPHPVLERGFTGPYPDAVPVLIRHLTLAHPPKVREGIIRALTIRLPGREVEDALLAAFRAEMDPSLRWVLASALRTAMPYHRRRRLPEIKAAYESGSGRNDQT
jgi:hypothetical protein